MASLKKIEADIIIAKATPKLSIEKLTLYAEVVLMIVQFVISKGLFVNGKVTIKWWDFPLFIAIIKLFKEIIQKIAGEDEPIEP